MTYLIQLRRPGGRVLLGFGRPFDMGHPDDPRRRVWLGGAGGLGPAARDLILGLGYNGRASCWACR